MFRVVFEAFVDKFLKLLELKIFSCIPFFMVHLVVPRRTIFILFNLYVVCVLCSFKFGSGFGFFVDWVRELLFYVYSVVNPLLFICTQNNFHWAALRKDLSRRQHPHRPHRPHLTHGHGPQTSATKAVN